VELSLRQTLTSGIHVFSARHREYFLQLGLHFGRLALVYRNNANDLMIPTRFSLLTAGWVATLLTPVAWSQQYSIGSPSSSEQLYLELTNRARANPPAEGQRLKNSTDPDVKSSISYFKVDLNRMANEFNAIAAAAPLSMNAKLLTQARAHSQNMLTFNYQSSSGPDGTTASRAAGQGYAYSLIAENTYSYSRSVIYGHSGFEIDWGGSLAQGGMQTGRGHRTNIHDARFREVGIGGVTGGTGNNGNVGPQLVTQTFAVPSTVTPFITGVAYHDDDGDSFYDEGEGVGGVNVAVAGVSAFSVTAASGGYSVPVPGNGTYTVTFTGGGLADKQVTATVSNSNNVKVDYVAPGVPPVGGGLPTLTIASPTTNPFTTGKRSIGVAGVARDDKSVARVEFKKSTASTWSRATFRSLTGKWNASLAVAFGTNLYQFRAIDNEGKISEVKELTVNR